MKTNVIMTRKMGKFDVKQRTKDGMFNATFLLEQWNASSPKSKKEKVLLFLNNKKTKEFISELKKDEEFLNGQKITHLTNRGKNGGTWMHPYLFIDFAMWLNPKFKVKVIKFVYDELIKNRHSAGDKYKLLSESGVKLKGYNFSEVATAMNYIVFGKKGKELRQNATQDELKELTDIQTKLSFAIDMGYIKSYEQLMKELRKVWNLKNKPF